MYQGTMRSLFNHSESLKNEKLAAYWRKLLATQKNWLRITKSVWPHALAKSIKRTTTIAPVGHRLMSNL
jgi:hypothetical protein